MATDNRSYWMYMYILYVVQRTYIVLEDTCSYLQNTMTNSLDLETSLPREKREGILRFAVRTGWRPFFHFHNNYDWQIFFSLMTHPISVSSGSRISMTAGWIFMETDSLPLSLADLVRVSWKISFLVSSFVLEAGTRPSLLVSVPLVLYCSNLSWTQLDIASSFNKMTVQPWNKQVLILSELYWFYKLLTH